MSNDIDPVSGDCDHKGPLFRLSWGACCGKCGEPYPFTEDAKQVTDAEDITVRLRSYANWLVSCASGNTPDEAKMASDAADEIELLRQELGRS